MSAASSVRASKRPRGRRTSSQCDGGRSCRVRYRAVWRYGLASGRSAKGRRHLGRIGRRLGTGRGNRRAYVAGALVPPARVLCRCNRYARESWMPKGGLDGVERHGSKPSTAAAPSRWADLWPLSEDWRIGFGDGMAVTGVKEDESLRQHRLVSMGRVGAWGRIGADSGIPVPPTSRSFWDSGASAGSLARRSPRHSAVRFVLPLPEGSGATRSRCWIGLGCDGAGL